LEGSGAEAGKQFWSKGKPGCDLSGFPQEGSADSSFDLPDASGRTVLTGFHVLLMRLLGRSPKIFWASRLRRFPELHGCVGPLAKFLPFALEFDVDLTFDRLEAHAERAVSACEQWQDYYPCDVGHVGQIGFEEQDWRGEWEAGPELRLRLERITSEEDF